MLRVMRKDFILSYLKLHLRWLGSRTLDAAPIILGTP
jgi:hypothetical protein